MTTETRTEENLDGVTVQTNGTSIEAETIQEPAVDETVYAGDDKPEQEAEQPEEKPAEEPAQEEKPAEEQPAEDPRLAAMEEQLKEMHAANIFGSADRYKEALAWGASNLSPAEVQLFDQYLERGNPEQVAFLFKGLAAMSGITAEVAGAPQQNMQEGTMLQGQQLATGTQPFASNDEAMEAIADPRYYSSTAYRNEVEARLAVSSVF